MVDAADTPPLRVVADPVAACVGPAWRTSPTSSSAICPPGSRPTTGSRCDAAVSGLGIGRSGRLVTPRWSGGMFLGRGRAAGTHGAWDDAVSGAESVLLVASRSSVVDESSAGAGFAPPIRNGAQAVAQGHEELTLSLWWAARRYIGLIVLVPLVGAILLGLFVPSNTPEPSYRASALVVATELNEIRADHLPRMVEAIVSGHNVPRLALERTGLEATPAEFREMVEVETIAETVVIRVSGLAPEPELAAEITNATAAALVGELNRIGPEAATFAIQEAAARPDELEPRPTTIPPWLIGGVVGFLLAVGVVLLLVVVRRPVLTPEHAQELTGLPVLGALRLQHPSVEQGPDEAEGVVDLVLRLYPRRNECMIFLGPGQPRSRAQVSLLVARAVALNAPVMYGPGRDRFGRRSARIAEAHGIACTDLAERAASAEGPVVIDGPWSDEVRLRRPGSLVLVLTEGVSSGAVARYLATRSRPMDGIVWAAELGLLRSRLYRLRAGRSHSTADLHSPKEVRSPDTPISIITDWPRANREAAQPSTPIEPS
jgi:capsular polysaccharide biosynthesis protein